jgi:hypothetical protein
MSIKSKLFSLIQLLSSSKSYLKIGHQSEAVLENNLIKQLRDLSY